MSDPLAFAESAFSDWLSINEAVLASSSSSLTIYEELRIDLAELLAEFKTGSVAVVRQSRSYTSDPLAPISVASQAFGMDAVVFGYTADLVDNSRIMSDDRKVIVCAGDLGLPVVPTCSDVVEIDGVRCAIASVQSIPAAGLAVAYIMQARRIVADV